MNTHAEAATRALGLLDLTSLGDNDTDETVTTLCQRAVTPAGHVAAVCIWPRFIPSARAALADTEVRIATVANFPGGTGNLDDITAEIQHSISLGALEVDVVYPWQRHLRGDLSAGPRLIEACRAACGDHTLKVILETGELHSPHHIRAAAEQALQAGADFLKTSTGKTPVSATPQAARTLLQVIADSRGECGFKASGGISSTQDAMVYLNLADQIMGPAWVAPARFRFGASSLLDSLLQTIAAEG